MIHYLAIRAKAFVLRALRLVRGVSREYAVCFCAAFAVFASSDLTAATTSPTYAEEYSNISARVSTQALGSDLFGERINLSNGTTEFGATDVAVKTNGQIPLTFGRKLVINAQANYGGINNPTSEILGRYWQIDVPYMRGTFPQQLGWVGSNFSAQRCTFGIMPPNIVYGVGPFHNVPYESNVYWTGTTINVPGQGEEELLNLPVGRPQPSDGRTYFGATKSEWRVACLPTIKNGSGEGFIVALPNGTKYHFDWMASRSTAGLVDTYCNQDNGLSCYTGIALYRDEVFLYATKAEDRFGNSITYTYDPNNPHRLLSTASSDGASIQISYNQIGKVSTVTTAGRTWTYAYAGDANTGTLSSVTLPDSSQWSYQHNNLYDLTVINARYLWEGCQVQVGTKKSSSSPGPGETGSLVITHPSGAKGEFLFRKLIHGSNRTPGNCTMLHPGDSPDGSKFPAVGPVPSVYQVGSIYSKKITGPGLAAQTWAYTYAPSWSFNGECNPSCASSSQTFVMDPDGVKTTYTFGNDYVSNFGQLISTQIEQSGTIFRKIDYTYITNAQGQPFPDVKAIDYNWRTNKFLLKFRPLSKAVTAQQGTTYTWQSNGFDQFANPTKATRSSTPGGYTRTDATAYHHNMAKWVIGQVASSTCLAPASCANLVEAKTDYDANALPWKTWAFGKLQQTLVYTITAGTQAGTLKTVTDGNNNITNFSDWKRGIPQKITFADAKFKTAVVNNIGGIDSVTDENGYITQYGYDAMGRLSSIDYPDTDTVNWTNTTRSFVKSGVPVYGLTAGHWEQTVVTGNGRQVTYFDALWRPVVQATYDGSNTAATLTQIVTRYNAQGQPTFASYPQRNQTAAVYNTWANPAVAPNALGTDTVYDALGRVKTVTQDSELGPLATQTAYLYNADGPYTVVTNPRGFQTRTWFQAYDQPNYDTPVWIWHPEGAYTYVYRDVFGKPTSILRRNADASESNRRFFTYDAHQQVCKTSEAETATTAYSYDAAGNLAWSAGGLPWSLAATCEYTVNHPSVTPNRVDRTYDARNRLKTLVFPDGLGNQAWTYTPDGLPATILTNNGNGDVVSNAYAYNKRRLMTGENLTWDVVDWSVGYDYNANGHPASQAWHGVTVDYAPNGLGQPTKAGIYASGVSYHPNGAIKQFTYGNGLVHEMTQNLRQLPDTSCDSVGGACTNAAPLRDGYDYDQNGNVAAISDGRPEHRGDRTMSYDGLDRLKTTDSPMFGHAGYAYDTLDNMTRLVIGGTAARDHYYCYDVHNQLTNVKTGSCNGTSVIGLGYDVRGNLANKNGTLYGFDIGNRLRSVSGAPASRYVYDGHGRRVLDEVDGLGKCSQYGHSGQLVLAGDDRANTVSEYVYLGGSLLAIRERDVLTNVYTTKYQHTDALGSPVAVTNDAQTVIEQSEYEPYGGLLNRPLTDGPGYTGHVSDAQTGLSYMQQRYYDPKIGGGRFLSVDPVTADSVGGNFNRYWYANNNPYKFKDPDGRFSCSDQNQTCSSTPRHFLATSFISPIDMGAIPFREQNYTTKPGVALSQPTSIKVGNMADAYNETTDKKLVVTDGSRTAQGQASRMHYKITNGEGVRLYANRAAANEVLDAYSNAVAANLERNEVISSMADVIADQMARGVYISGHLRDGAVDFRSRDMTGGDHHAFRAAAGASKVLREGVPPHYHVEF